jgi:hypothetical protein
MRDIPAEYIINAYRNMPDMVFERFLLPKTSDRKSEPAKASETARMAIENESKKLSHACSDGAGRL